MHPYAYCSIILNSQDIETTLVPINKWMDKDSVCVCVCVCLYTHIYTMQYCSYIKENETCHLQQYRRYYSK